MDKINYYLYHIPGKKIGVTRDLISRVVEQQGYDLDEVEVLEQSTDINYISDRELELQLSHGYRVDRQKYKDLYINQKPKSNNMNINATEQTSTFPCPVSKLKGRLMDNMGMTWLTSHGKFEINMDTIAWIMKNATTSMYTSERCYIYNKSFAKYFKTVEFPFGDDELYDALESLYYEKDSDGKLVRPIKTMNKFDKTDLNQVAMDSLNGRWLTAKKKGNGWDITHINFDFDEVEEAMKRKSGNIRPGKRMKVDLSAGKNY